MKKYSVYGLGNALVDTEIQVEDQELAAMGVDKGVMTLVDESRQQELVDQLEGHLVAAKKASGGSAANSVIATTRFGKPCFYSCRVSNDANGDFYLQDLEAAGVDHNWVHDRYDGTTGRCLVLISPDAERSMLSYLGISETMDKTDLSPEAIVDSEYLYIEGYLVTSPTGRAAAVEARRIADEAGVKTSLSFSDPGMVEFFRDGMEEILGDRPLDLLFCNEAEAQQWAGSKDRDTVVASLLSVSKSFAVTLGAKGALIHDGENLFEVPGTQVDAVDTNGAGDMFAGAFLYALSAGHDFELAARFANQAAARVVARFGPRLSASEHDELFKDFFGA